MKEENVSSFAELHEVLDKHRILYEQEKPEGFDANNAIFRGVTSNKYKLITSLGRMQFYRKDKPLSEQETLIFDKFRQRALPHLTVLPADLWDWLALAQHHGLPTRLLDWTLNPLVAAFFAVEDDRHKGNSVIYVAKGVPEVDVKNEQDPFLVSEVFKYIPGHVASRLVGQAGLFTVHPQPDRAFEGEKVILAIKIAADARRLLKKTLYWYGIHRAALFPGLDGLCNHIRWLREDTGYDRL